MWKVTSEPADTCCFLRPNRQDESEHLWCRYVSNWDEWRRLLSVHPLQRTWTQCIFGEQLFWPKKNLVFLASLCSRMIYVLLYWIRAAVLQANGWPTTEWRDDPGCLSGLSLLGGESIPASDPDSTWLMNPSTWAVQLLILVHVLKFFPGSLCGPCGHPLQLAQLMGRETSVTRH